MSYDRGEVLRRVDLAELADSLLGARHPRTRSWSCPNSNHSQTGRTPPLGIFTDRRGEQRWRCHGCGEGGTAIDLAIRAGPAHDFKEALEWLARRVHVDPSFQPTHRQEPPRLGHVPAPGPDTTTRRALRTYVDACAEHLHSDGGREVRQWLTELRAIPLDVLREAQIGADPGPHRLIRPDGVPRLCPSAVFPVRTNGNVVFTQSRLLRPTGDMPRWLNTASTVAPNPRLALLGPAEPASLGPIVVTEGMLDGLSAVTAGLHAAALLGSAAASDDVADGLALLGRPLLLATDNDDAGRRVRERLAGLFAGRGVQVSTLEIPGRYKDLNEWHVACREQWTGLVRASARLAVSGEGRGGLHVPEVG